MRTNIVTQDVPANALDLSADGSQVVIAGRHVFKIFSLDENGITERANLRSAKHLNLNFSCNDVVWNPVDDNILATASTNGAVVTWNLNKQSRSKQDCVFNDHTRTVHKVSFHPSEGHLLISGSHDGFMKLFDLRRREATMTFTSNAESVRDVQFNPHHSITFSGVSENGNIQLWDMRRPDRVERQFTGHGGPIFALDWHPDIRFYLATAGRDKTIKVWDLHDNPTEVHTIQTIASVGQVKWRPNTKYHIASSALLWDCSVNVWDTRRPYIPIAAFHEHRNITSGICWTSDPNILLSVGKDSTLIQHWFPDCTRPMEDVNPSALCVSVLGCLSAATPTTHHHTHTHTHTHTPIQQPSIHHQYPTPIPITTPTSPTPTQLPTSPSPRTHTPGRRSITSNVISDGCSSGAMLSKVGLCQSAVGSSLSTQHLITSAQQYILTGRSLLEICEHNAGVARALSRHQVALTWQILPVLYHGSGELVPQPTTHQPQSQPVPSITSATISSINTSKDEGIASPDNAQDSDQRSSRQLSGGEVGGGGGGGGGVGMVGGGDTSGGLSADEGDTETDDTDTHDTHITHMTNIASEMTGNPDFFFGDGEVSQVSFEYDTIPALDPSLDATLDPGQHWTLPTEAFEPRHDILHRSPALPQQFTAPDDIHDTAEGESSYIVSSAKALGDVMGVDVGVVGVGGGVGGSMSGGVGVGVGGIGEWECGTVVTEMLKYYAGLGDVQMAVTCFIILGHRVKGLLEEAQVEHWFAAYIEILHRFRLYNVANQVIQLAVFLPSIMELNQKSSSVTLNCGRCNGTIMKNPFFCVKCGEVCGKCAVCHGMVKGLYVWCQGCLHGGHLQHIIQWFQSNTSCPSGCGHLCEYT